MNAEAASTARFHARTALLLCIFAGALLVRLLWVWTEWPRWSDPDGYVWYARQLADGTGAWSWNPKAVTYVEFVKAPLYQVFLSAFTAFPRLFPIPASALVAHAVLNAVTALLLFSVGCELHSRRAGFIAAIVFALWLSNIQRTTTVWQEHLYLPLLTGGFALLGRAIRTARTFHWVCAGALFGAAALTRSSVAYFVVPAAIVWPLFSSPRGRALRSAAALLAAFALLTVPYSLYISQVARQPVFIENIGAFTLKRSPPSSATVDIPGFRGQDTRAPTGLETLALLKFQLLEDPRGFIAQRINLIRLLLKPAGTTLLPALVAETRGSAHAMKAAVHLSMELPFVLILVLAPFGMTVARSRPFAILLVLWVIQQLGLLALTAWAGFRFRTPVEPALIVLASTFAARDWRPSGRVAVLIAGVLSLGAAALVATHFPSVAAARANYGVPQWYVAQSASASFLGSAGLNVPLIGEELIFSLRPAQGVAARPVDVVIHINGREADRVVVASTTRLLRYRVGQPSLAYVEVFASSGGRPAAMFLQLPQKHDAAPYPERVITSRPPM